MSKNRFGWISTKDALPADGQQVFCLGSFEVKEGRSYIGFFVCEFNTRSQMIRGGREDYFWNIVVDGKITTMTVDDVFHWSEIEEVIDV